MSAITPNFAGEMQLAGWTDSHTAGCKVTFWLQSTEDLEAFRALTVRKGNQSGHRFMAVLVEVGDDEMPVPPPVPEKPKGGPLSKLAGVWCNDPEFFKWLIPVYDSYLGDVGHDDFDKPADFCKHCVLVMCEVASRAELDHDAEAAERFHSLIRGPFSNFMFPKGIAL